MAKEPEEKTVREHLKEYASEDWEKAQEGEHVTIELFPVEDTIHNCWYCGERDCPTGVHLSGWRVGIEHHRDIGWIPIQIGDAYCDSIQSHGDSNFYYPQNWEYEMMFSPESEEDFLDMKISDFWEKVEEVFGLDDIDKFEEHNEEEIKEYEEELEKLARDLKEGKLEETQTEGERERLKDLLDRVNIEVEV